MLTGIAVFVAPSILSQLAMALVTLFATAVVFDIPSLVWPDASLQNGLKYWIAAVIGALIVAAVIALRGMRQRTTNDVAFSRLLLRLVIMSTSLAAACALLNYSADNVPAKAINIFVAISLIVAAVIAWIAFGKGGLPPTAGAPPDEAALQRPTAVWLSMESLTYVGAVLTIPILALFVSGFAPLNNNRAITLIPEAIVEKLRANGPVGEVISVVLNETSKPAGLVLFVAGVIALAYLGLNTSRLETVPRHRMYVVLILTFFSMVFFAFFEQAGSSINNFTDRNVNRVIGTSRSIQESDIGTAIAIQPTQQQLGYSNGNVAFTMDQLTALRESNKTNPDFTISWHLSPDNVGMIVAERSHEIPASWFQSVNAVFILIFGLVFTAVWSWLSVRGIEPGTPL
jgi:dipeptide/tripeptide permease